jgi:phospholipid transport system substrate-binding protein
MMTSQSSMGFALKRLRRVITGRKAGRHLHRDAHIETHAPPFPRRHLLCLVLVGVAAGPELASGATAGPATAPIERFYVALLTVMKAGKTTPFQQRYDSLAAVIDQTFDLEQILGNSIGPRWAALPSDQQSALKEAFRRYTIAVYVANFDSFSGQRFEVQPASTAVGEEQIVQTRIVPASGESHRLDYVMRPVGGTWKVVDVLADGSISRVAVQRSEMRSPLANGGVPALLDRLQRKTADMSGGQLR